MKMQRWTLVIHGKVQGVFYRQSAAEKARALGLTGTVRNLENGDVKLLAEGPEAALEQLYSWCQQGPERAQVDKVVVDKSKASGEFTDFIVAT
ncbi:MAG: acylphosphatase [Idiomarina sp.]|nr:acylphosphatase [Idiomarina sp.]